jgi:hypothetical protein
VGPEVGFAGGAGARLATSLNLAAARAAAVQHSNSAPRAAGQHHAKPSPAKKPRTAPTTPKPPHRSTLGELPGKVIDPIGRLGDTIKHVTGFSLFGGPVGWILVGLLVVAVGMIGAALVIGRRRRTPTTMA